MEIRRIDDIDVKPESLVRVKEMGNITEVMYSDSYYSECNIVKLSKDYYLDKRDGEVKAFQHIENRACDLKSISKTLSKLRDYLNTNITDVSKCRWVTLTYAENMTDTKQLYEDFKKFNMRLRHHLKQKYEYIVAMEPQGRGAWHCHLVMIFPDKAPYIPNDDMARIWGHGFTKTKKLDDVDNVGAYLTAYLGDMDIDELNSGAMPLNDLVKLQGHPVKQIEYEEDGVKKTKSYVKGARLFMYPPQFNLYRCSRGIKKPDVCYMPEEMAQKKVSGGSLTFQKTIQLSDVENDFDKTINYRYYNSLRTDK